MLLLVLILSLFAAPDRYDVIHADGIAVYHQPVDSSNARLALQRTFELFQELKLDFGYERSDSLFIYIAPGQKAFEQLAGDLPKWTGGCDG